MTLLDISIQSRVIIGISAMVFLFASFLIAFISNQRKKMQYHKKLSLLHEKQQMALREQNIKLEERVQERTHELSEQKEALQVALADLKSSQLQLVQKEKMASLGEMASGIAHEIQNPLNFVTNFSDLNIELLTEMRDLIKSEKEPGKLKEELDYLLENSLQNIQKISLHGKRADNIVKSLLQHARSRSDEAMLYDINTLVEDNLNLSYHNICTKDKNFSALINSSLDHSIDQVSIIPQDISRVLTNLYDNAFYSIHTKSTSGNDHYTPQIDVTTRKEQGRIKIIVRDNGTGISQKIMNKIYQPFFTTKPTGEGTGLGLSLSYDIIKAHRGDLHVESREGEFAEFVIDLPL
jgi:two-component system, NtrC family, sensor kinase